jgi:hypothetical protein
LQVEAETSRCGAYAGSENRAGCDRKVRSSVSKSPGSQEYLSFAAVTYCASTVMPKLERRKENGLESNWQLAPSDRGCNSLERGGKLAAAQAYQQIKSRLGHTGTRFQSGQRAGRHPTSESVGNRCQSYEPMVSFRQQCGRIYALQRPGSQARARRKYSFPSEWRGWNTNRRCVHGSYGLFFPGGR